MGTREARSYHLQRKELASAANQRAAIDESVWASTKELTDADTHKIKMKDVEAKLAAVSATIRRMDAEFRGAGYRNNRYTEMLQEKENLTQLFSRLQREWLAIKRDRKSKDAIRSNRAVETRGDTFRRFARMMLADDVYEKISSAAMEEWARLYDR